MVFSVQQVKYEFLAYIKEFDPYVFELVRRYWPTQPRQALFERHGVRDAEDPCGEKAAPDQPRRADGSSNISSNT